MTLDQFTSPTILAILILLALAFVRFGVWWGMIRAVLRVLLRPAGLVVVAVAAVAVMQFG